LLRLHETPCCPYDRLIVRRFKAEEVVTSCGLVNSSVGHNA
jgi:hypothetical protein